MNERYLFKGKRKDNGEWVYGGIYYQKADEVKEEAVYIIGGSLNDVGAAYEVILETVGQCTGLKDKNGKLIFEGDICKHRSNCSDKLVISVVTYTDGHFLALVNEHSGFELSEKLEIIGNCHDTPELLEVKE